MFAVEVQHHALNAVWENHQFFKVHHRQPAKRGNPIAHMLNGTNAVDEDLVFLLMADGP